ncbi:family S53 protease [Irpex rosettiformis]|uniref:Family S53 protease n=1 Tax=Irpex rosettiformis TaxID=378272 RepID=A0ACB8UGS7_9APHY|nr:family S53 protease [Irpex rosettiformis]
MHVHESRSAAPVGFVKAGAASPDTVLNMRMALAQNNPAGLEKALMDVSTPGNALYGQHLTKEEVEDLVRPTQQTVDAVNAWLAAHNITAKQATPAGNWLKFSATVAQANQLLDTQFSNFKHEATGIESIRTLAYSIPADLVGHVELVHPTVAFSTPQSRLPIISIPQKSQPSTNLSTNAAVPSSCASTITPTCLQDLYGIPATAATQSSNHLGVSGFIGQFANQADLRTFLTNLRPDINPATVFTLQTLDGGQNTQTQSQAGIEADLDTQYTIGIATGVPVTFISTGNNIKDSVGGFFDLAEFLLGESAPPSVVTTSYGENEQDIGTSAANQLCSAFQQLGARGVSILYSSGDGGVAGSQTTRCTNFLATFPSGCPFMTSVGATTGIPETAASFSSGGFSNVFAQPSYQASAVSAFLTKLGNTNSGKFNRAGRAFPDIAAMGDNVEIVFQQQGGLVAGTSCSSPIFASIISLINDRLVSAGKSPLGFLNPFLYGAAASTFTDITTGNNPGCNTNGFPAVAGWDPVTGLGTPNFQALLNAALAA